MDLTAEEVGLRFGFGLPLREGTPRSVAGMVSGLKGADTAAQRWPLPDLQAYVPLVKTLLDLQQKAKAGANVKARDDAAQAEIVDLVLLGHRTAFARAIDTAQPLRERLITFFADHFTANARGGAPGLYLPFAVVEDAIRPNIGGDFATMLRAVTLHPAMLIFLDQQVSVGPNSPLGIKQGKGLNENLARELLELHSLGVDGGYVQDDVRQLAELLTGLTVERDLSVGFDPRRVEPGAETVMGKSYGSDKKIAIRNVLTDLALHPATAGHIARKLAVHFLSDQPAAAAVAAARDAYAATKGDIPSVMSALLSQGAARGAAGEKLRQPFDFIAAACRALGVSGADIMALEKGEFKRGFLHPAEEMGQKFKYAPGPDGWPEEADVWVTPPRLAARIDWAMRMPQRLVKDLPDPVMLAKTALGARASETLLTAAARAESRRDGVGIVLSSPEFNRR